MHPGWALSHELLVRRMFLEAIAEMMQGFHAHVNKPSAQATAPVSISHASLVATTQPSTSPEGSGERASTSRSLPGCSNGPRASTAHGQTSKAGAKSPNKHGHPVRFDAESFLEQQVALHGESAQPLLAQLVQTLGFFAFLEQHAQVADPYAWHPRASMALRWV